MQGLDLGWIAWASYLDPADMEAFDTEPDQRHAEIQKCATLHGAFPE